MTISRQYALLSLLIVGGVLFAQSQGSDEGKSLGEIARELRTKTPVTAGATTAPAVATPTQTGAAVVASPPEIDEYMRSVAFQMYRKDFAQLDRIADEARSTKARFPGGGWKLHSFYVRLATMSDDASEADWQERLTFFTQWMAARPQSITARIALASAYSEYAWEARGRGYADRVTPEGWRLFHDRLDKAAQILIEATKLEAKCPHWYVQFQIIGRGQGLDKEQLRRIFNKAVAFEPDYFYIYQQQVFSLLPRWQGEEGDAGAFVEETYRRVGGQKGAMLYFQIASSLCSECGDFRPQQFSWPTLQEGFAALEQTYGLTPVWLNRFARMAVLYEDKPVAAKAFARIGDNWDQSMWESRAQFEAHRAWAGLAPLAPTEGRPAFVLDTHATEQLNQLLSAANQAADESRWNDAAQSLRKVIETAKRFPETDYWLQKAYLMLAVNEQRQGHVDAARSIMDEEVELVKHRNGADSTEVAAALDGRAMLEQQMNDDKHAEADFRRAIAIRQKVKSPSVQLSMEAYALAMLLRRQSRYREAITLLQPLIPAEGNPDPRKEQDYAWLLQALGMAYQDLGHYQEAEAAYLRMMRILDVMLPVNSVAFTEPLSKLASLYHAVGKDAEAQKIEQRLQEIQQSQSQRN